MIPITLLAAQSFSAKLSTGDALQAQINALTSGSTLTIPSISRCQILSSSAPADLADKNVQLGYPRICTYSGGYKNTQVEKFRSLSGQLTLVTEIWASGDLITDIDNWIHFYVEGVTNILQTNKGDWGNGLFYPGIYDVQFQAPKAGGLGFVQSAKLTFHVNVSAN